MIRIAKYPGAKCKLIVFLNLCIHSSHAGQSFVYSLFIFPYFPSKGVGIICQRGAIGLTDLPKYGRAVAPLPPSVPTAYLLTGSSSLSVGAFFIIIMCAGFRHNIGLKSFLKQHQCFFMSSHWITFIFFSVTSALNGSLSECK